MKNSREKVSQLVDQKQYPISFGIRRLLYSSGDQDGLFNKWEFSAYKPPPWRLVGILFYRFSVKSSRSYLFGKIQTQYLTFDHSKRLKSKMFLILR